jgi:UDP-2-acetamido-2,6-beta-L-arabino-hexul-4-ose reductase
MIVGGGDIASKIKDDDGFLFFASGVSDSKCTDREAFAREEKLLLAQETKRHLVYFSSLSIYRDGHTAYIDHKYKMEQLARATFPSLTIMRLGNITWGDNPTTLINYLKGCIRRGERYWIRNVYRFITDEKQFKKAIGYVKRVRPADFNQHGTRMTVAAVVRMIKNGEL